MESLWGTVAYPQPTTTEINDPLPMLEPHTPPTPPWLLEDNNPSASFRRSLRQEEVNDPTWPGTRSSTIIFPR